MDKVIGIDVGGTSIKAGLFTCDGVLEGITKIDTREIAGTNDYSRVADKLFQLLATHGASPTDIVGLGLDFPGPVDKNGKAILLPNTNLDANRLKAALQKAFPLSKLAIVNDVNAAALGELWRGAGKNMSDFVFVALGTGVGAGVVVNGKLVPGAFGAGGEIGHLTVNVDEPEACGCGRHGCLEQYASATGIVRSYVKACTEQGIEPVALDGPTDTISVFAAHRTGDKAAKDAVSMMCDRLGFALAQVSAIVDPGIYLIGGGVGKGFDLFAAELHSAFKTYCMPTCADTRIVQADLGNEAAMYGCAFLASQAAIE